MSGITSLFVAALLALGMRGDGKSARPSAFAEDRLAPGYVAPAPAIAVEPHANKKRKRQDMPNPIRGNKQPDGTRIGGAGRVK